MIKQLANNHIYDIHILLTNENEIKCKILTDKTKGAIKDLIENNLESNVSIEKIYSISSLPKIDFIDTDILV